VKEDADGKRYCEVCQRDATWGCGHTGSQERDARRHEATKKHAAKECACYGHDHCDPKTCKLAGIRIPGYLPYYQHTEAKAVAS
jgi:hypothetical protein